MRPLSAAQSTSGTIWLIQLVHHSWRVTGPATNSIDAVGAQTQSALKRRSYLFPVPRRWLTFSPPFFLSELLFFSAILSALLYPPGAGPNTTNENA